MEGTEVILNIALWLQNGEEMEGQGTRRGAERSSGK